MTDRLLIYLCQQDQSQDTDSEYDFDTTIIGDLLGADVGYAVTDDGEPLQFVGRDRRVEEVYDRDYYVQSNTIYNSYFCGSDPETFSDTVELFSGEQVSVADYDVVLISHFWLHHHYLRYLQREHPAVTYVGIQEESVQDVLGSAGRLQAAHFETVADLDGLVAFNEQYRRWIEPHRPNVLRIPLPVPPGHFDDCDPPSETREAVCLGVGTWNVDNANFYTNVRVLDRVRRDGPDLDGEIVGIQDRQRDAVDGLADEFEFLTVRGYMTEEFYDYLSTFEFAIISSTRATAGRVAAEFAGLGVPCIGNRYNDLQARCWPELAVDPYDVPTAVALANRLVTDDAFYRETVETARRELSRLQDLDRIQNRLERYVEEVHDG